MFIPKEMMEDIVRGLIDIFGEKLDSIILYGSVARGDDVSESDIDIALIVNSGIDDDVKSVFLHWNAELDIKYNKIFSIIDIEKDTLDKWGNVVPFYKNIQSEGIVLWKAA